MPDETVNAPTVQAEEALESQMESTAEAVEVQAENPTDTGETPAGEEVHVDANVAFNVRLQEFDKLICEAEVQVADLKKQKATFIYDTNVRQIMAQAKEQKLRAELENKMRTENPA